MCPPGSEPQALSSSDEDEEDSSPASPRSPSPKVSPGSPKRSSHSSGSSSGASSHGSSHEDLGDLKDRELLDEMIVKDVPEVSTDPVRQFEDSNHSSNPIDSIPEDTDQLENQCKDLIDNDKGNNISKSSFNDPSSSSIHSSDPILEMPSKEEETSPTCGLAAPDSKDSLEVQLYSVCDDISENLSGKEESMEDLKASMDKQDSSQSEDEKNSIIDDTKPRPVESIAKRDKESIEQAVQEIKVQAVESSIVEPVVDSLEIKYAETNGVNKDESFEIVEVDDVENKMPVHLESDVSPIDEVKKIVEEVKVEALNEVNTESEKQIDVVDESSKMTEVMEIFEKIESGEVSADPVKAESNSYQTTVKKIETKVSEDDECVAVTAYQTGNITQTTTVEKITMKIEDQSSIDDTDEEEIKQAKKTLRHSSSSSFEEVPRMTHQESTDSSSFSGKVEMTKETSSESESVSKLDTTTVKAKEADVEDSPEDDTSVASEAEKKQSSDSSDTEEDEQKAVVESSSDYDTSSAKPQPRGGNKRPDSFVSDTSSDYDSVSNAGSRRPQSFVVDDEYDVITEEETAEMVSKREAAESSDYDEVESKKSGAAALQKMLQQPSDDGGMADSSSSESEGPEEKEFVKDVAVTSAAPANSNLGNSNSDLDGISSIPPLTFSLHAEAPSSVSVDVAQSSVIHSNTLEEIDPLGEDGSPLTRSSDSTANQSGTSQGIHANSSL